MNLKSSGVCKHPKPPGSNVLAAAPPTAMDTSPASPGFTSALNQLWEDFSSFRLQQDDKFAQLTAQDIATKGQTKGLATLKTAVSDLADGLHGLAQTTVSIKNQTSQLIIVNESRADSHTNLATRVDTCLSESARQDAGLKQLMEGFQMISKQVKCLGSRNQATTEDAELPTKRQAVLRLLPPPTLR